MPAFDRAAFDSEAFDTGVVSAVVDAGAAAAGGFVDVGGVRARARFLEPDVVWQITGEATPDGNEARGLVGHVRASGASAAHVAGVEAQGEVGRVTAHGVKNLTDDELVAVLLEAA